MLEKIISGGQTGVDQAALFAAQLEEFPTGGIMPKGFRTQDGPRSDLAEKFGLNQHESDEYPPRTFQNVAESDATLRLAWDFNTAGERCTMRAIKQYKKPHLDVSLLAPLEPKQLALWIVRSDLRVLNVAGNSERVRKGTFDLVQKYLREVFRQIRELEKSSLPYNTT